MIGGGHCLKATGYKLQTPDAEQAQFPPVDPLEMGFPDTACIAFRLSSADYRPLFELVWGADFDIHCAIASRRPLDCFLAVHGVSPEGQHFWRKMGPLRRSVGGSHASSTLLQRGRTAFDLSGADDPDADRRLLLRRPLGTAAVRGGPPQIWPTIGSAACGSTKLPTIRPSRRTATAAFARATFCASCLRLRWRAA
jgi:hypothetical protein